MIVVTGAGRCGSSLMMQTLHLLGVPMIGDPENDKGRNTLMDEDSSGILAKQIIKMNPKGYWELPINDVYNMIDFGFKDHEGKAIKILAAPFTQLNFNDIDKVIYCKRRDRETQAKGVWDMSRIDLRIKAENNSSNRYIDWFENKTVDDIRNRQDLMIRHLEYTLRHYKIPVLDIVFEDIVTNPRKEIEKVVQFLDLDVDISKAIDNVDVRNEASI